LVRLCVRALADDTVHITCSFVDFIIEETGCRAWLGVGFSLVAVCCIVAFMKWKRLGCFKEYTPLKDDPTWAARPGQPRRELDPCFDYRNDR
jgi:hypothetical protein